MSSTYRWFMILPECSIRNEEKSTVVRQLFASLSGELVSLEFIFFFFFLLHLTRVLRRNAVRLRCFRSVPEEALVHPRQSIASTEATRLLWACVQRNRKYSRSPHAWFRFTRNHKHNNIIRIIVMILIIIKHFVAVTVQWSFSYLVSHILEFYTHRIFYSDTVYTSGNIVITKKCIPWSNII